jgi:5'-deoxynucleotidase YfbR-like HD superfamily hydrolase
MFTNQEVMEEVKKIQYLYGLKREIRYAEVRTAETESVAEHIYAMHVLAQYFLELENPEGTWNRQDIFQMITWHDIDEVETGDTIGYLKTQEDKERGLSAIELVISKSPKLLQGCIDKINQNYQNQITIESRFVKAIDKIEPVFHLYNENGKNISLRNNATYEQHKSIKDMYVAEFPYIKLFNEVVSDRMKEEGFFVEPA